MEMASKSLRMGVLMKESSSRAKYKAKESMSGLMVSNSAVSMLASSRRTSDTAKER